MNENKEIAIQLSGVKKMYKLGQIGGGTLQGDLQSWWARVRGKEDPNAKIGQKQRLVGQSFMALNGIDLTVYKGEALGIIGANGAGKSTMVKLLSRVTAPTEGVIDIYGRIASMLEVGTGFNMDMTGRENIYMNGAILGMTKAEIDAKMEDIIEFSEVREFIDTPVKRYSSGMYVKLAFSVAAHLDSEIMIMDEVLAVGDMAFQQKCINKMSNAGKEEGKTILYVSHNMNTVRQLCNRCVVLDKGKIIFDGDVEEAISLYMNSSSYERPFRDYQKTLRPKWLRSEHLRLLQAQYIAKDSCIFKREERVKIVFIWKTTENIDNAGLRFEIRNMDGTPIATSVSYECYSGKKDELTKAYFTYDVSALTPGTYHTIYTFFKQNDYGTGEDLDCVEGMDIIIDDSDNKLNWKANAWGHILLPTPDVEYDKSVDLSSWIQE